MPWTMTAEPTDFESPSPAQLSALLTGYAVEALVSSGKSGAIYEARQVSLERKVTVKVLPPEISKDAKLRTAFETEAKTMARLNDPNLVGVFDFGDAGGMLFIIMEHVPGRSLHAATHGSHVDQKESARLVADVCHGLHHAHQEGIIHRALEPRNILIDNKAQPKIVDFGLASLFAQQPRAAASPYAAPETHRPGAAVDHRADIYSAGMILYGLIVGHLPGHPYVAPSAASSCRPELDGVVARAIQPDPGQRYATAGEMARELEDILKIMGAPPTQEAIKTLVTAAPATGVRPLARPVAIPPSRSPGNAALVATLVTVAVLAGIILLAVNSSSGPTDPGNKTAGGTPPADADTAAVPDPGSTPGRPEPPPEAAVADTPPPPATPEPREDGSAPSGETSANPDPEPAPAAEPNTPDPPYFDRAAWLEKARASMRRQAKGKLLDYDKALLRNIDGFERDVKRVTRRMDRNVRKPAESRAEAAFVKLRETGRLPDEAPEGTPEQVKKHYKGALADQREIDTEFSEDFARLRITYIQGLGKQASNLRKEGNDGHADALDEEAKATREDMARFMRILRDQDPDPNPGEDGGDGN